MWASLISSLLSTLVPLLMKWLSDALGSWIEKKQESAADAATDEANLKKLQEAREQKDIIDQSLALLNGTPP